MMGCKLQHADELTDRVFAALAGLGGCKYDLAEAEIPADSVTHLVAASASKRTLKLLFAAARGIQVVSAEWLDPNLISPLHLPYLSPTSPLHLPYISPVSPARS